MVRAPFNAVFSIAPVYEHGQRAIGIRDETCRDGRWHGEEVVFSMSDLHAWHSVSAGVVERELGTSASSGLTLGRLDRGEAPTGRT